jgi:hypothetical protein
MLTKTKIALAAVLLAGSATVATAEYDRDPANRYPAYADPIHAGPFDASPRARAPHGALQSASVRLRDGSDYRPFTNPRTDEINENDWRNTDVQDNASLPFAGRGGI